jgi:hypothetical protein
MSDRLVIRVGGGYMMIDQFLSTDTEPELIKLNEMKNREASGAMTNTSAASKGSSQNTDLLTDIIEDDKGPGVYFSFCKINVTVRMKSLNEAELKNAKHSDFKKSLDGNSPHYKDKTPSKSKLK